MGLTRRNMARDIVRRYLSMASIGDNFVQTAPFKATHPHLLPLEHSNRDLCAQKKKKSETKFSWHLGFGVSWPREKDFFSVAARDHIVDRK